jgi:ABC-2 type transport system ATP-binding protein
MPILVIEGLTKYFKRGFWGRKVKALEDLSLEVEEGEVFGFLGPNGAGKTTTIKTLLRLIFPTRGRAWIMGKPLEDRSVRRRIGYMPENPYFYRFLTAVEFLHFFGRLNGFSRAERVRRTKEVLKIVDLEDAANVRIGEFSKGMTQRIGLAQSMLTDPDLILMDEPLSGVDPIGRTEIRDTILALRDRGKTIFFCSHILGDVESICERVAILNRGKLLETGKISELVQRGEHRFEATLRNPTEAQKKSLSMIALSSREQGDGLFLTLPNESSVDMLLNQIHGTNVKLVSLTERRQSLESYFMRLIGKEEKT